MQIQTNIMPLRWLDTELDILDQRCLPANEIYRVCLTVDDVADAIRTLAVRGAPLIGITAAYGMVIAARQARDRKALAAYRDQLAATRPTAVNLFWALERCWKIVNAMLEHEPMTSVATAIAAEAHAIHVEDAASCIAMAKVGLPLFSRGGLRVLTHCNTGALATGGIGTALGVIRYAYAHGKIDKVWVDETRPLLQGARLTAWELQQDGIPYQLICDNMAASLMEAGKVDLIIVGADRITRAGDFANKIGTYGLAALAKYHGIPFYVAAPCSTIDLHLDTGRQIPVETRHGEEITHLAGIPIAPTTADTWNPAFDVTPGALVQGILTERGLLSCPL